MTFQRYYSKMNEYFLQGLQDSPQEGAGRVETVGRGPESHPIQVQDLLLGSLWAPCSQARLSWGHNGKGYRRASVHGGMV